MKSYKLLLLLMFLLGSSVILCTPIYAAKVSQLLAVEKGVQIDAEVEDNAKIQISSNVSIALVRDTVEIAAAKELINIKEDIIIGKEKTIEIEPIETKPVELTNVAAVKDFWTNKYTYEDVLTNIDIEYLIKQKQVKESITLKQPPTSDLVFKIELGEYDYKFSDDGDIYLIKGDLGYASFRQPFIELTKQKLNYSFDGTYYIIKIAGIDWNSFTYPLVIDPTYDVWDSAINTSKWERASDSTFGYSAPEWAETNSSISIRGDNTHAGYLYAVNNNYTEPVIIHVSYITNTLNYGLSYPLCVYESFGMYIGGTELFYYPGSISHLECTSKAGSGVSDTDGTIDLRNKKNIIYDLGGFTGSFDGSALSNWQLSFKIADEVGDSGGAGTSDAFFYIRNITYDYYYTNMLNVTLISEPNLNPILSSYKLVSFANATDWFGRNVNYDYEVYKNGVLFSSGTTTNYTNEQMINLVNISSADTNINDLFYIRCRAHSNDSIDVSSWITSNEVSISGVNTTLCLWDEIDNTYFNVANSNSSALYSDDNNTKFNFKATGSNCTNVVYNTSSKFRVEIGYSDGSIVLRYLDPSLLSETNEIRVCANKEGVTHYQQYILSSTQKGVKLKNVYSQCYVAADYTRFAYQGTYLLQAYTINAPYDLSTYNNGEQILLAGIDGGISTDVQLDVLDFQTGGYNINILGDTLTFNKVDNTTINIFYLNTNYDNTALNLTILKAEDNTVIYETTSFTNPNNFTLVFTWALIPNINETTLFKIQLDKTTSSGKSTITKYFNEQAKSGGLHSGFAFTLSIFLILFGLTFASSKITFSWFGIIIEIAAIVLLTFAIATWYITFLMVMEVIILIYTIVVMTYQTYPQVT